MHTFTIWKNHVRCEFSFDGALQQHNTGNEMIYHITGYQHEVRVYDATQNNAWQNPQNPVNDNIQEVKSVDVTYAVGGIVDIYIK